MPARSGQQYLQGVSAQPREVYIGGRRVEDVTREPGLANGARSLAALYDMQVDPNLGPEMTFTSPSGVKVLVPGFFVGTGSGEAGKLWKVRFRADEVLSFIYICRCLRLLPGF